MNCINAKYDDTEEVIRNAIFEHEVYLKTEGLIDDNTNEDYIKLIRDIANKKITIDQIKKTLAISAESLNIDVKDCGSYFITCLLYTSPSPRD